MIARNLLKLQLLLCMHQLSLQCDAPFVDKLGSCVYVSNRTATISWCNAAKFCLSIGGELLMDLDGLRAVNKKTFNLYYVGVTDLLVERHSSRANWRFANGSVFPTLTSSDWAEGLPNANSNNDDFLVVGADGFRDRPPTEEKNFVCQPIATPNSNILKRTDFLKLGDISRVYCYTDAKVKFELECMNLCAQRWECRAVLFNRVSAACRMLDFADSSVGDVIETDQAWVKFVKSY